MQTWLDCIKAFLVNTALALGTEEILLVTYLVSRNELECRTDSENVTHVYLMSFLLAMGCSRVQLITHVGALLVLSYGCFARPGHARLSQIKSFHNNFELQTTLQTTTVFRIYTPYFYLR